MRFRLAVVAAGLGVVTLMTGCDPTHPGARPAPAPSAPVEPTAATTSTKESVALARDTGATSAATSATASATAKKSTAADTGCPVTAETLLAALRTDPSDMYQRAGSPAVLTEATCQQGFAVARTASDGKHDRVSVLFRYDAAATAWRPVNLGSADFCAGVPAAIAAHLPGCE